MPVGDILICDPRGHVEHNDTTLPLDVISVTESTKLLLSGGIPNVEADGTKVGVELEGVDFNTESG